MALVARSTNAIEQLAREIGGGAVALGCDLSDAAAAVELTKRAEVALGGTPDVLVNNAGMFELARLDDMPESLFTTTLQTNLVAPFLLVRAFTPGMRARGTGHVVSIGSIADRNIMSENGAYSPAKYALRAMHEVLRLELRGTGVRATLVSPGPVDTPMWDAILGQDHTRSLPSRDMMLSPEAVAEAVLYAVLQPAAVNVDEMRLSHT